MSAPNLDSDDYYEVLGLSKNADSRDIKRAYRRLAKQHHPDQNPDDKEGAEERFKIIGEAYGVLSDEKKRQQYDQFGKQGLQGGMGGPGFSSMDAHEIFRMFMGGANAGGPGGFTFNVGGNGGGPGGFPFGDLFGGMGGMGGHPGMRFGGGHGFQRQQKRKRNVPSPLPRGTEVYLHNLSSGNFNRKKGQIQSYNGERFSVDIEGIGLKNIKPQNLCQHVQCELHSLNAESMNGTYVYTRGYTPNFERIECEFPDGSTKAIKPVNVKYSPGTIIRIEGLENATASSLNGKYARVLEYLPEKGRYSVQILKASNQYKIKPNNARL